MSPSFFKQAQLDHSFKRSNEYWNNCKDSGNMSCLQSPDSPLVVPHNRQQQARVNVCPKSYPGISIEHDANQRDCAVYIRDLCKRYKNSCSPVLEQLSMSVRKRTIYGLLGASGCGKTTILSCIVGLLKWDAGSLLVFGKVPGTKGSETLGRKLGYMPQETALYTLLTIKENIEFYTRLHGIVGRDVEKRWEFLSNLLELPADKKHVAELSGGQKRRVSLALALIHSPELLILDEPTVGLDPLLRKKIWNHLYKLANTLGTTIIITTHYIEEARLSNTVTIGVLRKGRLLIENTPENILRQFQCHLLEHAVLQLCRDDDNSRKLRKKNTANGSQVTFKTSWSDSTSSSGITSNDGYHTSHGIFRQSGGFDIETNQPLGEKFEDESKPAKFSDKIKRTQLFRTLIKIYGITAVILLSCSRYPLVVVLILILPTVQGVLTALVTGSEPFGLNFGIVNNEVRNWTEECSLPIHAVNSCYLQGLSCKIINELQSSGLFILNSFETEEEAIEGTHLGRNWGYLTFQENFTQNSLDVLISKQFSLNESLDGSQIPVHLDHSQYLSALFMTQHLFRSYLKSVRELAVNCFSLSKYAETSPLHFRTPVYGDNEGSYSAYIMPGQILSTIACFSAVLTAVLVIADRKQGTFHRARVAGLSDFHILISHLITEGATNIAQTVILGAVLLFCFEHVIHGSLWLCLAISLFTAICSTVAGLFLGMVCTEEVEPIMIGVFLVPVTLLYGGAIWPVKTMPIFWRSVARILPTSYPVDAMRSVTIGGVGMTHSSVWPGFAQLGIWTAVCCFLVGILAKYKNM